MNNLSWFIYLIHVVDVARDILTIVILVMGAFAVIGTGVAAVNSGEEWAVATWKKYAWRWVFIVAPISLILLTFLPNRSTMLLIAGSEIGQRAVASDGVRSITDPGAELLRTWIKTETDSLLREAAPRAR